MVSNSPSWHQSKRETSRFPAPVLAVLWVKWNVWSLLELDNDSPNLLSCPNCWEDYDWENGCYNCWNWALELAEQAYFWSVFDDILSKRIRKTGSNENTEIYFQHWSIKSFNISQTNWDITMFDLTYLWKTYRLRISYNPKSINTLKLDQISIEKWNKFRKYYVTDNIFRDLRNFTLELLKFQHSKN